MKYGACGPFGVMLVANVMCNEKAEPPGARVSAL